MRRSRFLVVLALVVGCGPCQDLLSSDEPPIVSPMPDLGRDATTPSDQGAAPSDMVADSADVPVVGARATATIGEAGGVLELEGADLVSTIALEVPAGLLEQGEFVEVTLERIDTLEDHPEVTGASLLAGLRIHLEPESVLDKVVEGADLRLLLDPSASRVSGLDVAAIEADPAAWARAHLSSTTVQDSVFVSDNVTLCTPPPNPGKRSNVSLAVEIRASVLENTTVADTVWLRAKLGVFLDWNIPIGERRGRIGDTRRFW